MDKETHFSGVTATPSDYNAPDGQLALAQNLVPEDGTLKPVLPPLGLFDLTATQKLVYIHKNAGYTHYIIYDTDTCRLYWADDTDRSLTPSDDNQITVIENLHHVTAVGNTLILLAADKMLYTLWKTVTRTTTTGGTSQTRTFQTYDVLGDHLPNVEISFGLRGNPRFYSISDDSHSTFNIQFDDIAEGDLYNTWSENNQKRITEQVMARVNKFLRQQSVEKGRFSLPFLLRYALRLYDGSLVCHSAPVLMNPSTGAGPVVLWNRITGKGAYNNADIDIMLMSAALDYKLLNDDNDEGRTLLSRWKDIVKSVDVFITRPIYTWKQDGQCKSFNDTGAFNTKFIGTLDPRRNAQGDAPAEDCIITPITLNGTGLFSPATDPFFTNHYREWPFSMLYALYRSADRSHPVNAIALPELSDATLADRLKSESSFYKLCSITLDDLSKPATPVNGNTRTLVKVPEDYLQSLANRELMTVDFQTHDSLAAEYSHVYNSRLNLAGLRRSLFRGFSAAALFAWNNDILTGFSIDQNSGNDGKAKTLRFTSFKYNANAYTVTTFIREDSHVYAVRATGDNQPDLATYFSRRNEVNGQYDRLSWGCYVFYPNPNAYKMAITVGMNTYVIDLKPHDFLNGAFAMLDYETVRSPMPFPADFTEAGTVVSLPNKIYTSEVDNPFFFPALGVNTVGTGRVLGISAAVRALSQGQFGQFPLYAFTTEGVWALKLNDKGTYQAVQPVSRDVCNNPDSITQIDTAVLFTTDRGVMLVQGSETVCISDSITGLSYLPVTQLPAFPAVLREAGLSGLTLSPFSQFAAGCRMLYDYRRQRIILYNPDHACAYIYSLRSKLWGMMDSAIQYSVNAWPDALAVAAVNDHTASAAPTKSYALMNFSAATGQPYPALAVTRPLKFDAPDVFKTITAVIQRGFFRRGHVKTVLWGSNDLTHWVLVWSSVDHVLRGFAGTPYKFYRLASLASLLPDETLTGFNTRGIPRLTNDLR